MSILDVKKLIKKHLGVLVKDQRVQNIRGEDLDDDYNLEHYDIETDLALHLVIRGSGGGKRARATPNTAEMISK
eukprot:2629981-Heterocapsa_arctica.AAC.1